MNRKKHTIFKKRISILSILIPIFLISGCAKDPTPPVAIPVAPPVKESVVPHLKRVTKGIDDSLESNTKIDSKLKEQKDTVLQQQMTISETIAKTERLKDKIVADEIIKELEVVDIINDLKTMETRNLFLEKQNSELETIRTEQEAILKMTKEDASITYRKLLDKENEANELRSQNKFLANSLNVKNNEVETLKKSLEKEKIKSARATVYKNWVYGLVWGFILWIIIKNILMVYFPMTKFRI
jgi:tetrahydromethanopterin S-methyltransferase subunit B